MLRVPVVAKPGGSLEGAAALRTAGQAFALHRELAGRFVKAVGNCLPARLCALEADKQFGPARAVHAADDRLIFGSLP